jgi:cyclophilin family peptidyl-prolyl cis-trans isomerase
MEPHSLGMRAVLVVLLVLLVAGCVQPGADPTPTPSPTPTTLPSSSCPAKSFAPHDIHVTIDTTKGKIGVVLYGARAPITVCNFLRYVEENFYDNTIWHRVCSHVIQAGGYDPYAVPGMQQKKGHDSIQNEANTSKLRNLQKTIGMARDAAPDSADTHFFVNLHDNTYLDWDGKYAPGYAVFANVTAGWDVVQQIASTPTVPDPPPQSGPLYMGCNGVPQPGQQTTIKDIAIVA